MRGTNTAIGGGGFHHLAMRVCDFDRSVAFYVDGLGFRKGPTWGEGKGRAILLDSGDGAFLELFAGGAAEPKPEGAVLHFALKTSNCDAAIARAQAAGATVTMTPKSVDIPTLPKPTSVRIAFCKGPDGELIEFFQSDAV